MEDNNLQSTEPTQSNQTNESPTLTSPMATQAPTSSSTPKKSSKLMMVLMPLLVIVLSLIAAYGGYKSSSQKSDKKITALNSQIALIESNEHALPDGAIKVSDCIPNMGFHYVTKTSDKEYGPFLLVTKSNKVIGVEYMADKDMYTAIPNTNPPVEVITKDSPMFGWKYDHTEFGRAPKGHEGLMVDHIDVHMYTVTADQQKQACI
jgi:hypothetical protein